MLEKVDWKEEIKTEPIVEFGGISVNVKTILLIAGQSMAGKTITCIHFLNEAIIKNIRTAYFDIDEKTIIDRQEPNLFKELSKSNQKKYDSCLSYYQSFDKELFFEEIEKLKPALVILDGIYHSFCVNTTIANERAKLIKDFLIQLREFMKIHKIGVILTTPIGKITKEGKTELVMLGGESIKYLSDVKVMIQFVEDETKDSKSAYKRIFFVDKNHQFAFNIDYGGKLIPINYP